MRQAPRQAPLQAPLGSVERAAAARRAARQAEDEYLVERQALEAAWEEVEAARDAQEQPQARRTEDVEDAEGAEGAMRKGGRAGGRVGGVAGGTRLTAEQEEAGFTEEEMAADQRWLEVAEAEWQRQQQEQQANVPPPTPQSARAKPPRQAPLGSVARAAAAQQVTAQQATNVWSDARRQIEQISMRASAREGALEGMTRSLVASATTSRGAPPPQRGVAASDSRQQKEAAAESREAQAVAEYEHTVAPSRDALMEAMHQELDATLELMRAIGSKAHFLGEEASELHRALRGAEGSSARVSLLNAPLGASGEEEDDQYGEEEEYGEEEYEEEYEEDFEEDDEQAAEERAIVQNIQLSQEEEQLEKAVEASRAAVKSATARIAHAEEQEKARVAAALGAASCFGSSGSSGSRGAMADYDDDDYDGPLAHEDNAYGGGSFGMLASSLSGAMGVSRVRAEQALVATDGDLTMAMHALDLEVNGCKREHGRTRPSTCRQTMAVMVVGMQARLGLLCASGGDGG